MFYNVLGQLVQSCVAGEAGAVVDKDTLFAVFASAEAMGKLFGAILNQPDPPPPLPDYWEPAAPRPKLPPPPTLKELGQGNLFAIGGGISLAARIAEALAGHKVTSHGGNYLVCCPAHDDSSPSLSLSDGDRGLMVHCFVGCSAGDVYAAIRRKGQRLEPTDTARQPDKGTLEYRRQQADKAAWLWGQRRPLAGSIAEQYLRGARNYSGLLPPTLAFMPARKSDQHPAMIAAFALVDEPEPGQLGKPTEVGSVHLTLLKPDGSGKASTKPDKLIIGSPVGKPIVLAPPNDLLGLAITEGIEDALSAHEATGLGAWAAGAAGFMPKLADVVPDHISTVTIFAHADAAGQDGARKLAAALRARPAPIEVTVEGAL